MLLGCPYLPVQNTEPAEVYLPGNKRQVRSQTTGQVPSALSTYKLKGKTLGDPYSLGIREGSKTLKDSPTSGTGHPRNQDVQSTAACTRLWVKNPACSSYPHPQRLCLTTNRSNRNLASWECREKPSCSLRRHHCSMRPPRRMRHLLRRESNSRRFSCLF